MSDNFKQSRLTGYHPETSDFLNDPEGRGQNKKREPAKKIGKLPKPETEKREQGNKDPEAMLSQDKFFQYLKSNNPTIFKIFEAKLPPDFTISKFIQILHNLENEGKVKVDSTTLVVTILQPK